MSKDTKLKVAVACINASGCADMPVFTVSVTQAEYDLGVHYDKAEELAEADDYEGPFICFDPYEQVSIVESIFEMDAAVVAKLYRNKGKLSRTLRKLEG